MGHNGWPKYDELYRFKKERCPSSFWGTVDYELRVMFVNTPTGLANSPDEPPDHCGSSGIHSSFPCSSESRINISDYESHTKPEQFTNNKIKQQLICF